MEYKVSYCILTYNQQEYIEETLKAAVNQTFSPMEIIVSDDGSTDNTYKKITKFCEEYHGPNKIVVNRNEPNLGLREHYNKVLYELSHGEIIILADGDDVSISTRVEDYVKMFERFPEVVMVSSKSVETDENLCPLPSDDEWDESFSISTINDYIDNKTWFVHSSDSRGLRRSVINTFPPLKYPRAEDMAFFLRALIVGGECYIRKGYVYRRHHDHNSSSIRWTKDTANRLLKQMNEDVDFAKNSGIISCNKARHIKEKFNYSIKYMTTYGSTSYKTIRSFVYKVLSKLFNVRISR